MSTKSDSPKYLITLFIVFMGYTYGVSQLNIKVGYGAGFMESKEINDIIDRFNSDKPFLEQRLSEVKFLNGLELGLRYRFGFSAFEISMSNGRSYLLGVDNFIGDFGFGASISSRRLKLETDITGFDEDRAVLNDRAFASRFHVFYQLKSNNISLTFKPFIEIPWQSYNVAGLNKEYFPNSTTPDSEFDTDITIFGISILFYNGPQR